MEKRTFSACGVSAVHLRASLLIVSSVHVFIALDSWLYLRESEPSPSALLTPADLSSVFWYSLSFALVKDIVRSNLTMKFEKMYNQFLSESLHGHLQDVTFWDSERQIHPWVRSHHTSLLPALSYQIVQSTVFYSPHYACLAVQILWSFFRWEFVHHILSYIIV